MPLKKDLLKRTLKNGDICVSVSINHMKERGMRIGIYKDGYVHMGSGGHLIKSDTPNVLKLETDGYVLRKIQHTKELMKNNEGVDIPIRHLQQGKLYNVKVNSPLYNKFSNFLYVGFGKIDIMDKIQEEVHIFYRVFVGEQDAPLNEIESIKIPEVLSEKFVIMKDRSIVKFKETNERVFEIPRELFESDEVYMKLRKKMTRQESFDYMISKNNWLKEVMAKKERENENIDEIETME